MLHPLLSRKAPQRLDSRLQFLAAIILFVPALCDAQQFVNTHAGSAAMATPLSPNSVAVDASGDVYFISTSSTNIFKIDSSGTVRHIATNSSERRLTGEEDVASAAQLYPIRGL